MLDSVLTITAMALTRFLWPRELSSEIFPADTFEKLERKKTEHAIATSFFIDKGFCPKNRDLASILK